MNKSLIKISLFLLTALALNAAHAAIPQSKKIEFEILRDGRSFGTHTLNFSKDDQGNTIVDIDISMKYAIGPVTLFRYEHNNREVWRGNQLIKMDATTNDNGSKYAVTAFQGPNGIFDIRAQNDDKTEAYEIAHKIYPTTYWNKIALKSPALLNTQYGNFEPITKTIAPHKTFDIAGKKIKAVGYDIDASVPIRVWYDTKTHEWVGLSFEARGSAIEYKRLTPVG